MDVNDALWMIDIVMVTIQTFIVAFILREYLDTGFTPIGKLLISISLLFLVQSMVLLASYYYWWVLSEGDYRLSLPLLVSTTLNLVGLYLLYRVSKV